jgi:preprotein translocase SecE subunit
VPAAVRPAEATAEVTPVWKIYKEGQGKWGRGILAFAVGLGALYAVASLHDSLPTLPKSTILGWSFDYRYLIEGPLLIGAVIFGVWLFNHASTVDFLIETENELKNKVVWPSRQEEINASIVVVTTVVLLMAFIVGVDFIFGIVREWGYQEQSFKQMLEVPR